MRHFVSPNFTGQMFNYFAQKNIKIITSLAIVDLFRILKRGVENRTSLRYLSIIIHRNSECVVSLSLFSKKIGFMIQDADEEVGLLFYVKNYCAFLLKSPNYSQNEPFFPG